MEAALGTGWERAIHPDDLERLKREWQVVHEKRDSFLGEYRYIRPDGSMRWVLGRASKQYDSKGHPSGYIGVIVDITELRDASATPRGKSSGPPTGITSREREVAKLLAEGKSNRQVAEHLGISVRTAEAHRARVMRKLGLSSLAALVRFALSSGLVRP
jgi:DNA-binding NarL/FixJ family response regulator